MTNDKGRSRSGARWGWLLTTLALGASLGVASWANFRSARDAVSTIDLGQVGVFESVVRNALRDSDPAHDTPNLDSLVAAHADTGLRFVGRFSPEEGLTTLGGTPLPDPVERPRFDRGPEPVRIGDRIRIFLPDPRPMGRDRSESRGGGQRPAPPDPEANESLLPPPDPGVRADPGARFDQRLRTDIVIEFEPLVAGQLLARATRSLVLGALAAGLLMLTAFLFWRATLRREAFERTVEEQRRLSTLGELSAVLAHEIRNPLASLKGHAQLLAERTPEAAPERKRVGRIVSEAQRLEELTADLLDFVRTGPLDLSPVPLVSFLESVISTAEGSPARVDVSRAPESWTLDAKRMRQVLVNLLDNAIEASPEGVPIEVTGAKEGTSLVITFRDHGEGIPEASLERIFEPFFTTRTKGTGLGLAVARRIVELHGGSLTAHSPSGGGAEFRVTLMERKS